MVDLMQGITSLRVPTRLKVGFSFIIFNIFLSWSNVGGSATTGSVVGSDRTLKCPTNVEMRRKLWREGVVNPSSTFNHDAEKEDLLNAAQKLR
jgi:hypothetical protein